MTRSDVSINRYVAQATAADLVKGKASGMPVAIVRGMGHLVTSLDEPGARSLVRPSEDGMFRLGSREAFVEGFKAGRPAPSQEE